MDKSEKSSFDQSVDKNNKPDQSISEKMKDNSSKLVQEIRNKKGSHETDPIEFIRFLLMLTKNKPSPDVYQEISQALCYMLMQKNGLLNMIQTALDLDESSQMVTTFDQRFHALATIIVGLPKLDRSLSEFYNSLIHQIFIILLRKSTPLKNVSHSLLLSLYSIVSAIVLALEKRNSKLLTKFLLSPLSKCFLQNSVSLENCPNQEILTLHFEEACEVLLLLTKRQFPLERLEKLFAHMFHARANLQDTSSHLKLQLDAILEDMIISLPHFYYALDRALFDPKVFSNCAHLYKVYETDNGEITLRIKENEVQPDNQDSILPIESLRCVDCLLQCTLHLLESVNEDFIIDFFLILMQRCREPDELADYQQREMMFLLCGLFSELEKKVKEKLIQHPVKAIRFVNVMLERMLRFSGSYKETTTEEEPLGDNENANFGMESTPDSIQMCMHIIETLCDKQVSTAERDELEYAINTMNNVIDLYELEIQSTELKDRIKRMKAKFLSKKFSQQSDLEQDSEFGQAIKGLNSHLLPERANSLITLKRLIMKKNRNVETNKEQLLTILQASLSDSDSYIYLSAINALSALCFVFTKDVLPILIFEYSERHRTRDERIRLGEILLSMSKQLNEMAPAYSDCIMRTLLLVTKDEDEVMKVSAISNLGSFAKILRFSLQKFIVELLNCVIGHLQSNVNIIIKRACMMSLYVMLTGVDQNTAITIQKMFPTLYKEIKRVQNSSLDEVLNKYTASAMGEMDRLARSFIIPQVKRPEMFKM